jgi:hypothetical protein
MMLRSGEKGAGAEHVSHNRKTFLKFTKLTRVSEEEIPARLVKPIQGE